MYSVMKYKESYWDKYLERSQRIQDWLTRICAIFSAGSIVSWSIWPQIPLVWSFIVIIVQAIQVILPKLHYQSHISALKYMIPSLKDLVYKMECVWRRIDGLSAEEINKLMDNYWQDYYKLYNQYIGATYCPNNGKCDKKAETARACYFLSLYGVDAEAASKNA